MLSYATKYSVYIQNFIYILLIKLNFECLKEVCHTNEMVSEYLLKANIYFVMSQSFVCLLFVFKVFYFDCSEYRTCSCSYLRDWHFVFFRPYKYLDLFFHWTFHFFHGFFPRTDILILVQLNNSFLALLLLKFRSIILLLPLSTKDVCRFSFYLLYILTFLISIFLLPAVHSYMWYLIGILFNFCLYLIGILFCFCLGKSPSPPPPNL